jgi:hypothetical protein
MITRQLIVKKCLINYARNSKKNSNEQFLQASRNWEKCSALDIAIRVDELGNSIKKTCQCMHALGFIHYCLTDLSVDSTVDSTALVSGEQKHYFHLWGLQKPLVAFATRDFFRPHS